MAESIETTQSTYQETPYQDQSWEIVGERCDNEAFIPLDVPVIPRTGIMTDPMFADYGGVVESGAEVRWHIPDAVGYEKTKEAKKEDEGKLKIAPDELERFKRETFEAGLREGESKGVVAAELKLKSAEDRFLGLIQDLAKQVSENLAHLEQETVKLSLAVSEKVFKQAVDVNPEYIGVIVKEALSHAGSAIISRVRVSPQDMEFIEVVGIAKHLVELDSAWQFEKDDTVRAGCIVDTSAGEIDFRLDKAWDRVKDEVLKVLR